MAHTAIATFTHENLATLLRQGGSQGWRLDLRRAREREFLVCVQNRRHREFCEPGAAHGAIFLLGRICEVTPSDTRPGFWFIRINEFIELELIDAWHQRNPVQYTTLEALGIDLTGLPPLRPLPLVPGGGFSDFASQPLPFPGQTVRARARRDAIATGVHEMDRQDTNARLDTILAQIDRVPDQAAPFDPLDWDDRGLPR